MQKIPDLDDMNFKPWISSNSNYQTKSESKIYIYDG